MTTGFPQFVPQRACLSCDGCCRFSDSKSAWRPKMAEEEIDGLGDSADVFLKERDEGCAIRAVDNCGQVQCAFLNAQDNICLVYEHRPFECRLYPFLLIKRDNKLAMGVHLSCPYVQEQWNDPAFEAYIKILKQYFQQDEVLEFLNRNSMLIGEYPGYEQEIEWLFALTTPAA